MSSHDSPRSSIGPTPLLSLGLRSRRGSLTSLSSATPIDKEQLAQALDQIHSTGLSLRDSHNVQRVRFPTALIFQCRKQKSGGGYYAQWPERVI